MGGVIDSFKNTDKILGIRDKIGAVLKPVSIVSRTWSGIQVGEGEPVDSVVRLLPSPRVVDFTHDLRIQPGGSVQQGDILLKGISKESHPKQSELDGTSDKKNVEKFYLVGERLYQAISVREKYLTWNVQVRELSHQERF